MAKRTISTSRDLKDSAFLRKARERFKLANDADAKQAAREEDDLGFYAGDEQWPVDIRLARQGQQPTAGMPAVPARPTLVINKIREPIRQVQNEIRESDIGIELTPADDFGDLGILPDDDEITLREGLLRRIIRDSNGQDAWNWAGDRATIAGRGYFAVLTRYLPGKTNDQEIYLERIYNQTSVKGDPSRTQIDGSDASYWFWGRWELWETFAAKYPTLADGSANPFKDFGAQDFMALNESYPDWYRPAAKAVPANEKLGQAGRPAVQKGIRIENYAYTEYESRELVTLPSGQSFWSDEIPEGLEVPDDATRRTVVEPKITLCKIAGGILKLEETEWPSTEMPIIEVVGEELQPYDSERRVEGMVRNARGAQQGINYLVSKFVETVGLAPIPRDRIDPDAIEGYEAWWNAANTRTLPYLPLRTYDDQSRELRAPVPGNADPNILPIAQGISLFDQFVKSTTAVPDPTLGNVDSRAKSKVAIDALTGNAKASTSNFISNRVRSIERACKVINSLFYPVYGTRPGRVVRVMLGQGEAEPMAVGQPADPQQQQILEQRAIKVGKLTEDAKFNIALKVTKNWETRRMEGYSELGQVIAAEPQLMAWFGDLYFGFSDLPDRKQLVERAKAMLAPQIQQMLAAEAQNQPFDPVAQQQIIQLKQQIQHAEIALEQEHQAAEGHQLKAQAEIQKEQIRQQTEIQKVQLEADKEERMQQRELAAKIEVARITAAKEASNQQAEAIEESIALGQQHAHEVLEQQADQQHEASMAQMAAQQQADQADQQHQQALEQGEAQAQNTMAVQAAQPQPEQAGA